MGLMSFIKEAGESLFGHADATLAQKPAEGAPDSEAAIAKADLANKAAAALILAYVHKQDFKVRALDIKFDTPSATVNVYGVALDQATREKILLCCGNVAGVAKVNDRLEVDDPQPEAKYHEVVSGDTLSNIAKKFYGDASQSPAIFEANRPMLGDPDKIYPGQMLRIPAQ